MSEKTIKIEGVDLVMLFGTNNKKVDHLSKLFPTLKIIARGNAVKVIGQKKEIDSFQQKFDNILQHIHQYDSLTISQMERLVADESAAMLNDKGDLILHGQKGRLIKARTINQREMLKQSSENDMLFAIGPAGTGKTYTAVALAVSALKQKQVRRIILTRPAVEAGENLGFLPGDLKEKVDPYLSPLYDALDALLPKNKMSILIENKNIEIVPLAYMRGRTLDNAFMILDEAQNSTVMQMKMFLTRLGMGSKAIINGDITQIDLSGSKFSGLIEAEKILKNVEGIGFTYFNDSDIVRHPLVKKIIVAYDANERKKR